MLVITDGLATIEKLNKALASEHGEMLNKEEIFKEIVDIINNNTVMLKDSAHIAFAVAYTDHFLLDKKKGIEENFKIHLFNLVTNLIIELNHYVFVKNNTPSHFLFRYRHCLGGSFVIEVSHRESNTYLPL